MGLLRVVVVVECWCTLTYAVDIATWGFAVHFPGCRLSLLAAGPANQNHFPCPSLDPKLPSQSVMTLRPHCHSKSRPYDFSSFSALLCFSFPAVFPAFLTACWIRLIWRIVHGPSPGLLEHHRTDLLMMLIIINEKPLLRLLSKLAWAAAPSGYRLVQGSYADGGVEGYVCRRLWYLSGKNSMNFTWRLLWSDKYTTALCWSAYYHKSRKEFKLHRAW